MGTDTVCLSNNIADSCVNNFSFFLISRESGLTNANGILGLSPAANGNGPSYMKALHDQGQIDEYKVSFQLNTYNLLNTTNNYADFGTPVDSRYIGDQWHSNLVKKDDTWWTLKMNGFSYNQNSISSQSSMDYGIIDTGTSLMYLPPNAYNAFITQINNQNLGLTCTNEFCYSTTQPCSQFVNKLHPLEINLGQVKLTIPASGYLLDNTLYTCLVAVSNSGSELQPYIFGDTLIRNYYTTFDYKKKTVSFAVSSNAPQGVKVERDFTGWAIFGIVLSVLVGVILIAIGALYCYKRRFNRGVTIGSSGAESSYRYKDRLVPTSGSYIEAEP